MVLFCLLTLSAHAGDLTALTPDGYGPAKIGMTIKQASKALGIPLVTSNDEQPNPDCYHVQPKSGPTELAFMIQAGRIVRVSLYNGPSTIHSDRGIALGDPIDKVRKAYGKDLSDEEHEYLGPVGRYLTFWDEKKQRGMRYETDTEGKVDKIHAGGTAIQLIEGCS
jgi:hypothetical protein